MSAAKSAIPFLLAVALAFMTSVDSRAQSTDRVGESTQQASTKASPVSRATVVGEASWYGPGVQGHRTATGERFDSRKLTAASKQIPLGSHAVVTNLDNGRSVKVRVNDCGPVPPGRKVDLSKQAARRLGMIHDGTAQVAVKVTSVPRGATKCDGSS
ncbi:MAG: septal ring lytic transglycosylase RlpA family protein [Candidatus Binatus sp.]|jgi:rare lipoprotein A